MRLKQGQEVCMGSELGTFCLVRSPPLGRPLRADRELRAPASRHCLPRTLKVPPGWTPNIQRTQASHFWSLTGG